MISFECPICYEDFNETQELTPKVLKCGDTLCIKCIKVLYKNEEIICPLCKVKTNQKIEKMPTNKYAIQFKKSIICDKCLGEYSNNFKGERVPKILKCGDTFCLVCLKQLSKEGKIRCPFCGIESSDNINEIPVNKFIIDSAEKELNINIKYLEDKRIDVNNVDFQFSIGLLGETDGGKTSITNYFHTGQPFKVNPTTSIGFDFHYKYILINKKTVKISLWDTTGQERFRSISAGVLRGVHGLLLVFSLSTEMKYLENLQGEKKKKYEDEFTQKKFKELELWLELFTQFNNQEKRIIYLIGNKVDLENRIIKEKDALNFAKVHNFKYFETSAKTGKNIKKVFENLIIDLIKIYPKKICKNGTMIKKDKDIKDKDGKKCC